MVKIFPYMRTLIGHHDCYLCKQSSNTPICIHCQYDVIDKDSENIFLCRHEWHKVTNNLLNQPKLVDKLLAPRYSALYALARYQWPISRLISDLKFGGKALCADILINCLERRVNPHLYEGLDGIVAVPLSNSRFIQRQYNQSQLLCEELSQRIGLANIDLLRRRKLTKAQARLGKEDRISNVSDAFVCKGSIEHLSHLHHVMLVDDVLTTGATLNAACKAINESFPDLQISVLVMAIALADTQ